VGKKLFQNGKEFFARAKRASPEDMEIVEVIRG
jgi:hypothetical protein